MVYNVKLDLLKTIINNQNSFQFFSNYFYEYYVVILYSIVKLLLFL